MNNAVMGHSQIDILDQQLESVSGDFEISEEPGLNYWRKKFKS